MSENFTDRYNPGFGSWKFQYNSRDYLVINRAGSFDAYIRPLSIPSRPANHTYMCCGDNFSAAVCRYFANDGFADMEIGDYLSALGIKYDE
jgi:hypothetical protein